MTIFSDINIVSYGDFTLKSGEKSNYYIDMRKLISHPKTLKMIVEKIVEISPHIECVAGVPLGGIPYAAFLSAQYDIPMVLIRNKKKSYGKGNLIEGDIDIKTPITLIEDVITSGLSLLETIQKIESEGYTVKEIIVLIDREKDGIKIIEEKGYKISALFKSSSLLA